MKAMLGDSPIFLPAPSYSFSYFPSKHWESTLLLYWAHVPEYIARVPPVGYACLREGNYVNMEVSPSPPSMVLLFQQFTPTRKHQVTSQVHPLSCSQYRYMLVTGTHQTNLGEKALEFAAKAQDLTLSASVSVFSSF